MTTRRVVTTKQANADIEVALDHYIREGAKGAALNFIAALEDVQLLVAEHPRIGSTRFAIEINIPELRAFALPRFPYIAFYTDDVDAIRIHRVLHTSRDIPARFSD